MTRGGLKLNPALFTDVAIGSPEWVSMQIGRAEAKQAKQARRSRLKQKAKQR